MIRPWPALLLTLTGLSALTGLSGCHAAHSPMALAANSSNGTAENQAPVAALSRHTSSAARQQIRQAIVSLKGGKPPQLADTVFEYSDVLLLERVRLRDSQGLPIMGRDFQRPTQFQLQLRGDNCGLYDHTTNDFVPLPLLDCIAKPVNTLDHESRN